MDELCRLLRNCDLQFFCLEELSGTEGLTQSDTVELLSCFQQQQNLKVMALNIRHCGPRLGKQGISWPNLKALYIREGEEDWLDQLPEFEKLQILSLENLGPEIRFIGHSKSLTKVGFSCRSTLFFFSFFCHLPRPLTLKLDL